MVSGVINIAINLGDDSQNIRFPGGIGKISREEFVDAFSKMCNRIMKANPMIRLIFVPHIYADIKFIFEILEKMEDVLVRERITVASCLNGMSTDGMSIFDLYCKCDLVLGMRYHANVVPIGMNIPTLMWTNLFKIQQRILCALLQQQLMWSYCGRLESLIAV